MISRTEIRLVGALGDIAGCFSVFQFSWFIGGNQVSFVDIN